MNKKSILLGIGLSLGLMMNSNHQAKATSLWEKTKQDSVAKPSKYEKILSKHKSESAKSAFMGLYKMQGKVYLDLPIKELDKDMLLGATISSASSPKMAEVGLKNANPVHVRFHRQDSTIILQLVNNELHLNGYDEESLRQSAKLNYRDLDYKNFNILAYSPDSTSILFDASLFLYEDKLFPIISKRVSGANLQSQPQGNLTHITEVKAFEDNASVKLKRSYLVTARTNSGYKFIDNEAVTIGINYTLLRLPKEPMTPRLADSRIGYFQTAKTLLDKGKVRGEFFIKRWRLEPEDLEAYKRGELVAPKKPIVYYIDPTFPALWKMAIVEGVGRWNKAFEEAGFKDAVQVRLFPTDDPEFDPDNFKYSCFRYVPIDIENARGPSWIDPRSGEIVNASVMVYNDIANVLREWRFTQTAQIDERVRDVEMPDEVMKESLAYVMAHEAGHTLGLMHNMGASSAIPVDSLRSPSFTEQYGTTPSIMDYARFNYVAQPEDKGVKLTPPDVGVYDKFAIKYGYLYFPELDQDYRREAKALDSLLRTAEGNKWLTYGLQQFRGNTLDPSALTEDLGDDPMKAGDYGLKNLAYILKHLNEWIPAHKDESSQRKLAYYRSVVSQMVRYLGNVNQNVSGVYLRQTSESTKLPRYAVVPKDKQRASALWLLDKAKHFNELLPHKDLENLLPAAANKPMARYKELVYRMALGQTSGLSLSYYLDSNSYSPREYCQDVFDYVFEKTLKGEENLTASELELQKAYVGEFNSLAVVLGGRRQNFTSQELEVKGLCSCGAESFGTPYGMPEDLNTDFIDHTENYLYYYRAKTVELLSKAVVKTQDASLRLHYQFLLHKLKQQLKTKKSK